MHRCHDVLLMLFIIAIASVNVVAQVHAVSASSHTRTRDRASARRRKDESTSVAVHCLVDDEVGFSRRFYLVRNRLRYGKLHWENNLFFLIYIFYCSLLVWFSVTCPWSRGLPRCMWVNALHDSTRSFYLAIKIKNILFIKYFYNIL